MPSKRPILPSEDPPSASSSAEDDEEEEQQPTPKPHSKKPNSNSNHTQPHLTSDEEEDDSESESDSDVPTQNDNTSPALDIKPISSKPMTDTPKPKKPTTTTSNEPRAPASALASSKRKSKSETEEKDSRKDKKKKKVSDLVVEENETEKRSGDDHKKLLFQRLWTEQDEIVILKGMINFKKKGKDPSSQVGQLLDFIKDSLQTPDVNKGQLQTKLRTLKKKYQNAAKKAKPGEDPNITKPHEMKVYQLAKKVWGEDGEKEEETHVKSVGADVALVDGKKSKSKSSETAAVASPPPKVVAAALPNDSPHKVENIAKVEDNSARSPGYLYLNGSLQQKNPLTPVPPPGLGEIVSKGGWDVIGSEHAKDLDQRWKKVIIAETKAYLERIDLVREQTRMMLDVLESSKP